MPCAAHHRPRCIVRVLQVCEAARAQRLCSSLALAATAITDGGAAPAARTEMAAEATTEAAAEAAAEANAAAEAEAAAALDRTAIAIDDCIGILQRMGERYEAEPHAVHGSRVRIRWARALHRDRCPPCAVCRCDPYIYNERVRVFMSGWTADAMPPEGLAYEGVPPSAPSEANSDGADVTTDDADVTADAGADADAAAAAWRTERYFGETGAQSSVVPALDAALGVGFSEDELLPYLLAMRECSPGPPTRALLTSLASSRSIERTAHAARPHCVPSLQVHATEARRLCTRARARAAAARGSAGEPRRLGVAHELQPRHRGPRALPQAPL